MPLPENHYFGGDDEGGYVDWASARMIGKGGFAIVYCAPLKHVRNRVYKLTNLVEEGVLLTVLQEFCKLYIATFLEIPQTLLRSDVPVCI